MKILLPQRPGLVFEAFLVNRPSPFSRDELRTVPRFADVQAAVRAMQGGDAT